MFFSNKGKTYRLKGYEIPEFSRQSKGLPIINLLQIEKDETINSILKIEKEENNQYLMFVTKKGIVKKTKISEFDNIRATGKICITLSENDELIDVKKTNGDNIILLGSDNGKMVKFNENEIRPMGRTAAGVKGINLDGGKCICFEVVDENSTILLVTQKGYGKRTNVCEFRQTKRGSKGVLALNVTEKNGNLVAAKVVEEDNDVIIMTNAGITIKLPVQQISLLGRVTQGLRLISLRENQFVATVSAVKKIIDDSSENENNVEDHQNNEGTNN